MHSKQLALIIKIYKNIMSMYYIYSIITQLLFSLQFNFHFSLKIIYSEYALGFFLFLAIIKSPF